MRSTAKPRTSTAISMAPSPWALNKALFPSPPDKGFFYVHRRPTVHPPATLVDVMDTGVNHCLLPAAPGGVGAGQLCARAVAPRGVDQRARFGELFQGRYAHRAGALRAGGGSGGVQWRGTAGGQACQPHLLAGAPRSGCGILLGLFGQARD